MLKKYLGEAPFDVLLDGEILLSPDKKCTVYLDFVNDTEYEYPLCCKIRLNSSIEVDKTDFDVTLPAEGNTRQPLVFSLPKDSKLTGGEKICELLISDRIFDSKTEYEFEVRCEMTFKCREKDGSDQTLCSRNGVFLANKGERVEIQLALLEEKTVLLHITSGAVKGYDDGASITLSGGLNRLSFEMQEDGSFEFLDAVRCEKIYLDTLNPKYFI